MNALIIFEGYTGSKREVCMDWMAYKLKLFILKRKRKKVLKTCRKYFFGNNFDELKAEEKVVTSLTNEIDSLKSNYLLWIAAKLEIPSPALNREDLWEGPNVMKYFRLTVKGVDEVRRAIRLERKERIELLTKWAYLFIGIIGAITGLVAVIRK